MNINSFFEHWSIVENPFRAEEARHDPVFARLDSTPTAHPDFEKIIGDLSRPSGAIVFGEKGSGKTAIRLQLASRITRHNQRFPKSKVLLVPYDDLNPLLDRYMRTVRPEERGKPRDALKGLQGLKLTDHIDGLLMAAVPTVLEIVMPGPAARGDLEYDLPRRALRKSPASIRRDLQILQALYDRADGQESRAAALRRAIRIPRSRHRLLWRGLALWGWLIALAPVAGSFLVPRDQVPIMWWLYAFYGCLGLWALLAARWFILESWVTRRLARRIIKQLRAVPRSHAALASILAHIPPEHRRSAVLPADPTEEKRFAMLARLRRVASAMGYTGLIIVVDRVDEPTLVSGDPDRMRAVIWPLLNNKFLQQEGIGLKLLLPIELRHELFRESTAFFQEARLDKQSLVDRLSWTGSTLFDLCSARLRACLAPGANAVALTDLFEETVTRADLVAALEQMHQPRDAFKLLYQCIMDHCASTTDDQPAWRIPKATLDAVRKQQSDRVQQLARGIRPA